ncbi:glycosyltransferase family 4 protein [Acaryochloris sp. IP29b_bin.148]|uniref:glycosyltransferase family 4 protein n=1 Tax=Acaryochloris sp. IP29b_bin.148 TaxID=2969218 RepID=UPI0026131965|nr:glycosyltransferase family 4 protein [Acaryochloris sp. IP29b_bin.148]
MKVLIVNHYASPPSLGISGRHHILAQQLVNHGHEVLILASSNHPYIDESYTPPKTPSIFEEESVKYLILSSYNYTGNGIGRLLNILTFAWNAVQAFKRQNLFIPDIVIGSSVHPFAALAGERIARQYGIPFCFEVRDFWPQTLIDMKVLSKRHPLSVIFYKIENYLYKTAQRTIVLLPYGHEYICNLGIPKEKIQYIPNGIDLDGFINVTPPQQETGEAFKVMYLGSFGPANNLETLLAAALLLKQDTAVNWYLIGDGPEKERLKNKVQQLHLDNVFIQERVPKSHVPQLLMNTDALIFHLLKVDVFKYGISPNKLFDYLASFRPIVYACNARNNPVADVQAGLSISPEDPKAMAHAVKQLASMSLEERNLMGQNGRSYVEEHHDYKNLGNTLHQLLADVTEEFTV